MHFYKHHDIHFIIKNTILIVVDENLNININRKIMADNYPSAWHAWPFADGERRGQTKAIHCYQRMNALLFCYNK